MCKKKFQKKERKKTKQNESQNVNRTVPEQKQKKYLILKHFLMSGKWKVLRTNECADLYPIKVNSMIKLLGLFEFIVNFDSKSWRSKNVRVFFLLSDSLNLAFLKRKSFNGTAFCKRNNWLICSLSQSERQLHSRWIGNNIEVACQMNACCAIWHNVVFTFRCEMLCFARWLRWIISATYWRLSQLFLLKINKYIDKYRIFCFIFVFCLVYFYYIEIVQHMCEWQILNWITQYSPISRHWLTSTLKVVCYPCAGKRDNTFATRVHIRYFLTFSAINSSIFRQHTVCNLAFSHSKIPITCRVMARFYSAIVKSSSSQTMWY